MPRYRMTIEYDGRPYKGFQAQADLPTVQGSLERAARAFCGEDVRVNAAGRTDTGVHALGQVIHIDLEKDWRPEVVRNAINAHQAAYPVAPALQADRTARAGTLSSRYSSPTRTQHAVRSSLQPSWMFTARRSGTSSVR